jgi:hypothetical protein
MRAPPGNLLRVIDVSWKGPITTVTAFGTHRPKTTLRVRPLDTQA